MPISRRHRASKGIKSSSARRTQEEMNRNSQLRSRPIITAVVVLLIVTFATTPVANAQYVSTSGMGTGTLVSAAQNPATLGSVPSGPATKETIRLKLRDAITMALRYNLGTIKSGENERTARGQRLLALNEF